MADYERSRQDNIRRNREFLLNLGVPAGPRASKSPLPQRRPKRHQPPRTPQELTRPSSLPLRRSTRRRQIPAPPSPEGTEGDAGGGAGALHPRAPAYVDSSIFHYACEGAGEDPPPLPPLSPSLPISGFKLTGKTLRDPSLAKIYAMDVRGTKDDKFLVAAGGHGGFISVFGADLAEEEEEVGGCDGAGERGFEGPLLSWKGSRSWVSGVLFSEDNPMLLISSSNDGVIVAWDMSKQPSQGSSSGPPPVVAKLKGLHSGGIFAMHRRGCSIATASKDASLGMSVVKMDGRLVTERVISGHHQGVIRGVCFGETKHVLADCGADGCICILDARLPEPCTLTIASNHLGHINNVEWCPTNNFLLLSAGKDTILRLYDIRKYTEPVHKLQGHIPSNARICNQIYRPTFVDNGMMIATPGPTSKRISMYSVDEGKLISQGIIGYDANLVLFTGEHSVARRLWTAGKQINQLNALKLGRSL